MKVVGIVAEYNPFHRGHAWQIGELRRRLGGDTAIVVAMSGNFVQRGDLAVAAKHARAEMALRGGVDLVLEIPTPWATATAERFAQGGVALLTASGVVTHLAFGCECGDLDSLREAAEVVERQAYPALLREFLSTGMTFAAARQAAAEKLLGHPCPALQHPNNNLAVEYLRALSVCGEGVEPVALPRVGADHDSAVLGDISSASAIRRELMAGRSVDELLPPSSAEILARERLAGRGPVFLAEMDRVILGQLRRMEEEDFRACDGGGEGLYHRFYGAVRASSSCEELLQRAKTKRYPMARLRRMLLHSWLGVYQPGREEIPPYIRVLGANGCGRALLRRMREKAALPVITQPAEIRGLSGQAQRLFDAESRCTDQYVLAWSRTGEPDLEFKTKPVILA